MLTIINKGQYVLTSRYVVIPATNCDNPAEKPLIHIIDVFTN